MPTRSRVLLCTSNGAGLGHVTRMLAIAERLPDHIEPILFTLSSALPIPVDAGLRVEHLPSPGYIDVSSNDWHELIEDRVEHLISHYAPKLVAFDGVHPYRGLTNALGRNRRRVRRVWMRRGMWRPGVGETTVELARHFDHVVEPGEYAAPYDRGAPTQNRSGTTMVGPICYAGPDAPPDRATACEHLGLDPAAVNVLVQLGAGTINDVATMSGSVVRHLLDAGAHPVIARSVLSADDGPSVDGVSVVSKFPISAWFAAFDAAVIATGYNSFHECLSLAMPSLFVPNLNTRTDDQDARSRWAHDEGLGVRWDGEDPDALTAAISRLLDSDSRTAMRTALSDLAEADGARNVARLIEGWVT